MAQKRNCSFEEDMSWMWLCVRLYLVGDSVLVGVVWLRMGGELV